MSIPISQFIIFCVLDVLESGVLLPVTCFSYANQPIQSTYSEAMPLSGSYPSGGNTLLP